MNLCLPRESGRATALGTVHQLPNGRIHLCVNFQLLNSYIVTDPFPILNIETILVKASRAEYISKLNLLKGFHQVPMHPADIPKTSFSTPWGKWEYLRMPFSIKNGPSHFQRVMQAILGNLDFSDVTLTMLFSTLKPSTNTFNSLKLFYSC